MATNFPTSLDSLTNPTAGNILNSPSHSGQHINSNDAIEALEAKVGADSSAVTTSLDYKMRINNPTGEITIWATNTAPTGWLICDGTAVSRSTYSTLFGVLSTTYGAGNGSTTFNLPNLLGKVPVGRNASDTSFDTIGETGGSKTSALTSGNLPAHTHTASSTSTSTSTVTEPNSGQGHAHNGPSGSQFTVQNINSAGGSVSTSTGPHTAYNNTSTALATTGITVATSTGTSTTVSGGGNNTATGDAFSVLQPYIALNYIIRF